MGPIASVGVREFRANLHKYTRQSTEPIAITSHSEIIGYYVPAKPGPEQQELIALQEAVRKISELLAAKGVSEDEIVAEFQAARQHDPQP